MVFCNVRSVSLALVLVLAQGCSSEKKPAPAAPASSDASVKQDANDDKSKKEVVEQGALDAIKGMSDFLMTAKTLKIESQGSLDAVTENGQRIQLDGVTTYKIARAQPGFVIDYKSDIKNRRFIYDGKTFTVYTPGLGFYATVPAPGTIREVLDKIYDKLGISLPLEDLFRWSDPSRADRLKKVESAYEVGTTTIDGVKTGHYAFREPGVDWQIWIDEGPKPFPRRLVIIDRDDPAKPTFTANLKWTMNPTFGPSELTFKPGPDDKKISMATYRGRVE